MLGAAEETTAYLAAVRNLEELGLLQMAAMLPSYVGPAAAGDVGLADALLALTGPEVEARRAEAFSRRVRTSGFEAVKTLEGFDWGFQPSVPRAEIEELATLRFLESAENVLFVGNSGVGKSHLATAIGIIALRAGRDVRFVGCKDLVGDLARADGKGELEARIRYYARKTLLIVDEIGYLGIDAYEASLIFQLVSARYEKKSTVITTNKGIGTWAEVFGDEMCANAIADRICHHCHFIKIVGRSYRLKDLPLERGEEVWESR